MPDRTTRHPERTQVREYIGTLAELGMSFRIDGQDNEGFTKADHYITRVGVHRFDEYFFPFRRILEAGSAAVHLDDVLKLYKFDRKLRLLCLDALERVEIAAKNYIFNEFEDERGPNWLADPILFQQKGRDVDLAEGILGNIVRGPRFEGQRTRSKKIRTQYETPQISEAVTFGQLSKLFLALDVDRQARVARRFSAPKEQFGSWLYSLTYVRNASAHHNRLWNLTYRTRPRIPGSIKQGFGDIDPHHEYSLRFFAQASVIFYLLQNVARNTQWHRRLYQLLNARDLTPECINVLDSMGFSKNWHHMPFWSEAGDSQI